MKSELQKLLFGIEMKQEELAERIDRSVTYVSFRMTGKRPWDIDDVYAICDVLDIPYSRIPEYFPPRKKSGKRKLSVYKRTESA